MSELQDKPNLVEGMKLLQQLYVDTLKLACQEMANASEGLQRRDQLPDHLSEEAKNEIYMELIAPGLKKDLLNTGYLNDHEMQLRTEIHDLMVKINNIDLKPNEQVQKRRLDM